MEETKKDVRDIPQTIIYNQIPLEKSNGVGTAGFVIALIALFLDLIPGFLDWIQGVRWVMWALGFSLSFIGGSKSPHDLADIGFVISCIGVIILVLGVKGILGLLGLSH